jgi:PIN domain nuclease of toxin-antitoxin system
MIRLLLDTHMLLWLAGNSERLPSDVLDLVEDPDVEALFSAISLLEISIKHALGRPDFQIDPSILRRRLLEEGYVELPVFGEHAVAVAALPNIHKDPFDRLLVAQAIVEGVELLTVDTQLVRYPGPIRVF